MLVEDEGRLTFVDLKVRDGLPSVHCHLPSTADLTTTEVYDKLVTIATQSFEDRLQSIK